MLVDRPLRDLVTRRFLAVLGAALMLASGGLAVATPANAADEDPISWEWTSPGFWEASFQAGLPGEQYWLATTAGGGGGTVTFSAEPAGTTTTPLAELGLSVANFNATVVAVEGIVPDEAPPGVYEYLITARGTDTTTASRVLTITIAPALVADGPPSFTGPTDWYITAPGTYDFYPVMHDAETGHVAFPTEPFDSPWPFCAAAGTWWGGSPPDVGLHCKIDTLPEDGTYIFEVHAGNDLGNSVFTGKVHVGTFTAPTIDASSEVKVGVGNAFPAFVPALTGAPSPTVTIAPSGSNDQPLDMLGLALDPSTGEITGTVPESTSTGTYEYTLTATGAGSDSHVLTVVVGRAPVVSGPTEVSGLPGAALGDLVWTWDPATATGAAFTVDGLDNVGLTFGGMACCGGTGLVQLTDAQIAASAEPGTREAEFVTVWNDFGTTAVRFDVTVGEVPVIESSTPSTVIAPVGTAISDFSPTLSGGAPTSFSLTKTSGPDLDGLLPTGLAFSTATGAISGTATEPVEVGDYEYSLVAHGAFGDSAAHAVTVRVGQPPTVSPAAQDVYVVQGQYLADVSVIFARATGYVSGVPSDIGTWFDEGAISQGTFGFNTMSLRVRGDAPVGVLTLTPTATNDFGSTGAAIRIHVATPVTISGDSERSARQGDAISDWVPVVGGSGDITLSIDDAVGLSDLGLDFDSSTGTISGTLADDAALGNHDFEVTATGLQGSASTTLTITVEPRMVSLDLTRLGPSTVLQGGSVRVEVEVTDSAGNTVPVPASDLEVSSDVDSDVIALEDGLITVTFPHASPHTISVTQVSTGLTAEIVIEVTPTDADIDDLSDTGADPLLPLGVATALVLLGALLLVTRRRA